MTEKAALGDIALMAWRHGRLSPRDAADFEARLAADPEAQATLAEWDRQDAALAALHGAALAEPVPARMRALLDAARAAEAVPAPAPARRTAALPRIAAALALLALGAAAGWGAAQMTQPAPITEAPMLAALRAHDTFAIEVAHPVEVGAGEMAHLTGWLSKRLGQELAPPDLGAFGFRTIGGRVLPAASGAAALLMYENEAGERLTLYAAPQPEGGPTAFRFIEAGATQGFWWVDGAFGYAVVGDMPRDLLRGIAIAAYEQLI